MSKEINTEFKFTDNTTTTPTGSCNGTYCYFCKYYLPCGLCDKTGDTCKNAVPSYPTYPSHPWWQYPYYIWTSNGDEWTRSTTKTDYQENNTYTTSTPIKGE